MPTARVQYNYDYERQEQESQDFGKGRYFF